MKAMAEALHASPEELSTRGAIGRERVHLMHDASRNASLIVDAILKTRQAQSLVLDDVKRPAQMVEAEAQDADEMGEPAVNVESSR